MPTENRISTSSNRNDTEEQSVVIYDHLWNLVTNSLLADLLPKENIKKAVFNINSGGRPTIIKVHKNQYKVIWKTLATEMDNHADTNGFGYNVQPI